MSTGGTIRDLTTNMEYGRIISWWQESNTEGCNFDPPISCYEGNVYVWWTQTYGSGMFEMTAAPTGRQDHFNHRALCWPWQDRVLTKTHAWNGRQGTLHTCAWLRYGNKPREHERSEVKGRHTHTGNERNLSFVPMKIPNSFQNRLC